MMNCFIKPGGNSSGPIVGNRPSSGVSEQAPVTSCLKRLALSTLSKSLRVGFYIGASYVATKACFSLWRGVKAIWHAIVNRAPDAEIQLQHEPSIEPPPTPLMTLVGKIRGDRTRAFDEVVGIWDRHLAQDQYPGKVEIDDYEREIVKDERVKLSEYSVRPKISDRQIPRDWKYATYHMHKRPMLYLAQRLNEVKGGHFIHLFADMLVARWERAKDLFSSCKVGEAKAVIMGQVAVNAYDWLGNVEVHGAWVHMPTVRKAHIELGGRLKTMFATFRCQSTREITRCEKTYWFDRVAIDLVLSHLKGHEDYEVGENLVYTAIEVLQLFHRTNNHSPPIMNCLNDIAGCAREDTRYARECGLHHLLVRSEQYFQVSLVGFVPLDLSKPTTSTLSSPLLQ